MVEYGVREFCHKRKKIVRIEVRVPFLLKSLALPALHPVVCLCLTSSSDEDPGQPPVDPQH